MKVLLKEQYLKYLPNFIQYGVSKDKVEQAQRLFYDCLINSLDSLSEELEWIDDKIVCYDNNFKLPKNFEEWWFDEMDSAIEIVLAEFLNNEEEG